MSLRLASALAEIIYTTTGQRREEGRMARQKQSALLAAVVSLFVLTPFVATLVVTPAQATTVGVPLAPLKQAIALAAAEFAEPLVVTSPTDATEDQALLQALASYNRRHQPEDVSALTAFLVVHPHSGWAAALFTNVGLSDLHYGYFSRAADAWQHAWEEGKDASDPASRALVDRAVGELARLYANLGHTDDLGTLFDQIGGRAVSGSATEAIQAAREQLTLVRSDPRHLFNCGPLALRSLMLAEHARPETLSSLLFYNAGLDGTSLAELGELAQRLTLDHRLIRREPGQAVPVPSIVHWKVGHFAAIIGKANGRYHVQDAVFASSDIWVTAAALDAEASGYFLVPSNAEVAAATWKTVDTTEAGKVWGKGPTNGTRQGGAGDPNANKPAPEMPVPNIPKLGGRTPWPANEGCPLCIYNIKESSVSVSLSDIPVGYVPPIGPSMKIGISYNQREDSQPANFNYFNVGPKWTLSWLSYVIDDPTNPGANVSRVMGEGGAFYYIGFNTARKTFAAQDNDGSILAIASQSPISYRRQLRDGTVEIYAQANGSASYPRKIFLSQIVDPQGNAATLHYDAQQRLTSITDAVGRDTTFTYGMPARPLLVTKITDPFSRSATLTYDGNGRLSSITDIIGLTSRFTYDDNSLVNSLTTPYGTTRFSYTAPGTSSPPRFVQVTDPLGYKEREEWLEPAPVPASDPATKVPVGMPLPPLNAYLTYRDGFHWDKHAYVAAGCTDTGGCDYSKARMRHFVHMPGASIKGTAIESEKNALENRVWFNYPGQTAPSYFGGTYNKPIAIGRVLDDGSSQISQFSYDSSGYNLTQAIDPLGRTTSYAYANSIDLAAISQVTEFGTVSTLAQFIYNAHHRPLLYTDAAGRRATYEYNAKGQLISATDPLEQKTTYQYDANANLTSIVNANEANAGSYTYDSHARVRTYTDSEGWSVTYEYDAADRLTTISYPDSTTDRFTYDKLDLASYKDREGRQWQYDHDANRRLTKITDPMRHETLLGYNEIGELTSLADPKGNVTAWTYDIQGRLTAKTYADQSTLTYTYENTTSRLKSVLDALGQTKQYGYALDDKLISLSYLNAVNPTQNVGFNYDVYFPRLASMTSGIGTTTYSYYPSFVDGAQQPRQECFTATGATSCSHEIDYAYDGLGRLSGRTIAGSGPETFQYDAIGRIIDHSSDLGSFALSYLGQTEQLVERKLLPTTSNLKTTWSYLDNTHDRRLSAISNTGLATSQFTNFAFTTTPENFISGIMQTSDASVSTPGTLSQTASVNNLNQLTIVNGQGYSYDHNGNLLSDGQRSYSWDAENRLIKITYPAQSGKQTQFSYDGFGRRVAIGTTPAGGGSSTTTNYLWCGDRICQARSAAGSPQLSYFDEGEFLTGSPGQSLYYGVDQIGSVRRVFASASSAPTNDYDPFGVPLQGTAPTTDFGFAGMVADRDSSLGLTWYRAYDPVVGRWLSRDPQDELNGGQQNLYVYATNSPLSNIDLDGRASQSLPLNGPPGGSLSLPGQQIRIYNMGGAPFCDIDLNPNQDHGAGTPHLHFWQGSTRLPGIPIPDRYR
ncbi:peptidase C39 [Rhizobium sp. Root1203]|uniref:RHS repeat domain-containing protein n=1 Tax=Rhizobium sp. Root1203 TaxID=1736427 RepID=UPI000710D1AE|nr:RHS repeat-associated core domain-containing protein [Rhizobium sp. Root1203]KQV29314.1 peptidase C39 [Rhizobium sp. Root1203]